MKPHASYTTRRDLTTLAHHLHMGRVSEEVYGAGVMTGNQHRSSARTGWTVAQLLQMSAAKSMYN